MKPRSVAASALAAGLCALSLSTATATATAPERDASLAQPFGQFLVEQAHQYQLARNPELASRGPAISMPRLQIPDADDARQRGVVSHVFFRDDV